MYNISMSSQGLKDENIALGLWLGLELMTGLFWRDGSVCGLVGNARKRGWRILILYWSK